MGEKGGIDSELDYQEREIVIWADKLKSMGPGTLIDEERGGEGTEEGVIVTDVSNVTVIKGMVKTPSETPVIKVSPDLRALRNGNSDRGRMIRVVRHTLGRRDSC